MTSSGPEQQPGGPGPEPVVPGPAPRRRPGLRVLGWADLAVPAGALLYLVFLSVPWFTVPGYDLGFGYSAPGTSVNGFRSPWLSLALVLLGAAAVWTVLPAFREVRVPFPRAVVPAGLASLAFLLTLMEWLTTFDAGFTLMGLLAFLTATALLVVTMSRLLAELRAAGAAPAGWIGAPPPPPGAPGWSSPPYGPPGYGSPGYGSPGYGAPPTYGATPPPAGWSPGASPGYGRAPDPAPAPGWGQPPQSGWYQGPPAWTPAPAWPTAPQPGPTAQPGPTTQPGPADGEPAPEPGRRPGEPGGSTAAGAG
ncbi:hypothetical protein [Modestobacter sp. SYSU DS0657]